MNNPANYKSNYASVMGSNPGNIRGAGSVTLQNPAQNDNSFASTLADISRTQQQAVESSTPMAGQAAKDAPQQYLESIAALEAPAS